MTRPSRQRVQYPVMPKSEFNKTLHRNCPIPILISLPPNRHGTIAYHVYVPEGWPKPIVFDTNVGQVRVGKKNGVTTITVK